MKFLLHIICIFSFAISAYYSPGMTMTDSHQNQSHSICFGEADEGDSNYISFRDYNGATNGGNYHVIFLDMAASWWGSCWGSIGTIADIAEYFHGNDHVLTFTNLDDLNQPYSCNQWGNRHVQFGDDEVIIGSSGIKVKEKDGDDVEIGLGGIKIN